MYAKYKSKILHLHEVFQINSIAPEFHISAGFKSDFHKILNALPARVPIINKRIEILAEHFQQYSDHFVYHMGNLDAAGRYQFTITCNQLTAAIIDEYEKPKNHLRELFAEGAIYRPLKMIPPAEFDENHILKYIEHYIEEYTGQFADMVEMLQLSSHPQYMNTIDEMIRIVEHEGAQLLIELYTSDGYGHAHLDDFVLNLNTSAKDYFLTINKVS